MIDDFTPRTQFDTGNPLIVALTDHTIDPATGQTTPYNLTGLAASAFALLIRDMSTQSETNGAGTWSVLDAIHGVAQYAWNIADVSTVGTFGIRATVQFAAGLVTFETRILQIVP